MEDKDIIIAESPLGYTVCCSQSHWATHIIAGHAELENREADVKDALEKPCKIYRSVSVEDRHIYYSFPTEYKGRPQYTKVVTGSSSFPNIKMVVTAYSTPKITEESRGGEVLYDPAKSPKGDI